MDSGDVVSLAAIAIAIAIAIVITAPLAATVPAKLPVEDLGNVQRWLARMQTLDAWQRTAPEKAPR
ncbi:MAG TPA: hypothetical protein VN735_08275 [Steroidobacteraceae bacterium]|nr:hypothetical protein [Steroidobacteraceae bacterium]